MFASPGLHGQTAQFSGAQSTIPTSVQSNLYGVAVDGNRNVYIANPGLGTILEETLSNSGTYTESTIVSGLPFSRGLRSTQAEISISSITLTIKH
jgi:hypothetical protein